MTFSWQLQIKASQLGTIEAGNRCVLSCWDFAGERHRESVLQNIAVNLDSWTVQTKQETAIYHTLNKLSVDTSRKVSSNRTVRHSCVLAQRLALYACCHLSFGPRARLIVW